MQFDKQFVERDITQYASPYEDPFIYRSVSEFGIPSFDQLYETVLESSLARDDQCVPLGSRLQELIDCAGPDFDPELWSVAFLGDKPSGFVLPQRHPVKSHIGTLFHIGVVPELRGKNYGQVLHARGLQELAKRGMTLYIGSTDLQNAPMLDIFRANCCRFTEIRSVTLA